MNKFVRLLDCKNEAEKIGAYLLRCHPDKVDEILKVVYKYVKQFEDYCYNLNEVDDVKSNHS